MLQGFPNQESTNHALAPEPSDYDRRSSYDHHSPSTSSYNNSSLPSQGPSNRTRSPSVEYPSSQSELLQQLSSSRSHGNASQQTSSFRPQRAQNMGPHQQQGVGFDGPQRAIFPPQQQGAGLSSQQQGSTRFEPQHVSPNNMMHQQQDANNFPHHQHQGSSFQSQQGLDDISSQQHDGSFTSQQQSSNFGPQQEETFENPQQGYDDYDETPRQGSSYRTQRQGSDFGPPQTSAIAEGKVQTGMKYQF